jgi:hypothetical protein
MELLLDSKTEQIGSKETSPYVGSEAGTENAWGQPPLSHYFIVRDGQILRGRTENDISLHQDSRIELVLDIDLEEEFEAWDLLSDEALISFEQGLE